MNRTHLVGYDVFSTSTNHCTYGDDIVRKPSKVVNVDFAIIRKLERATLIIFTKGILVDLGIFRQFTVGLEIAGLICSVFNNYIRLIILEVS